MPIRLFLGEGGDSHECASEEVSNPTPGGVPLVWALLVVGLGGNAGLTIGWLGVLPMLIWVPVGLTITLLLTIVAAVSTNEQSPGLTADKRPDDSRE